MDLRLSGQIVFAAGASKGIGLATAGLLLAEGARVAVIGRSEEAVQQATSGLDGHGGEAIGIAADLSTTDGLAAALEACRRQLGEPDILVNCVGNAPPGTLADISDAQWQSAIDGKLLPAIRLMRELLPGMRSRGHGAIVNVAGLAGIEPNPNAITLGVMNAGLLNLTRALAKEAGADGVRVNAVLPGPTRTDRFQYIQRAQAERQGVDFEQVVGDVAARIPTGRVTEPEEVAAVIAFLVSDLASHVNGSAIAVDGGQLHGVR